MRASSWSFKMHPSFCKSFASCKTFNYLTLNIHPLPSHVPPLVDSFFHRFFFHVLYLKIWIKHFSWFLSQRIYTLSSQTWTFSIFSSKLAFLSEIERFIKWFLISLILPFKLIKWTNVVPHISNTCSAEVVPKPFNVADSSFVQINSSQSLNLW